MKIVCVSERCCQMQQMDFWRDYRRSVVKRKMLESYQINKRLIERNRQKIEDEQAKEIPTVMGKVTGSSQDFPYIGRRFSVEMDEPVEAEKSARRIVRWENEIKKARRQNEEIEKFISGIKDVRDREIFTYRYIDGMKVVDVAKNVNYTKGRVSQIIKKYVKD